MDDRSAGSGKTLFQSRRGSAYLNAFFLVAWILLSVATGNYAWWSFPIIVLLAVNAVSDWRSGVRVEQAGLSLRAPFFQRSTKWRWDEIAGFDHPDARFGDDAARGSVQLFFGEGSYINLPNVSDQPRLLAVLTEHLGPPRPQQRGTRERS